MERCQRFLDWPTSVSMTILWSKRIDDDNALDRFTCPRQAEPDSSTSVQREEKPVPDSQDSIDQQS
jgi:hypothetical protein